MSLEQSLPSERTHSAASRLLPLGFAAAIFLSALLLFGVQPMFAKMVLPTLGGSPAVWSVAMVFFQALLLLGYLYAHLSARFLTAGQALAVHAILVGAAFLFLPIGLPQGFGAAPEDGQAFWLLGLFGAAVGPPFFVLAATAPLLQTWFARSGHPLAGNPYQLYVASNLGSFCALIAYPLLVEPLAPLGAQASGWMALFALLALGLAACGIAASRGGAGARAIIAKAPAASWRERAAWTALAAVPSGLLVSVTAHLTTDVASVPMLWVLPLAIFLLTFILAFREEDAVSPGFLARGTAWTAPFVVLSLVGYVLPLSMQFGIHLGLFFLAAMACHGRLYRMRPAASGLTGFYLWMSFGGMLGGLFTGLLAPLLFDTIVEYRLLVVAALLCAPAAAAAAPWRKQAAFAGVAIAAALLNLHVVALPDAVGPIMSRGLTLALGFAFLGMVILNRHGPIALAGAAAAGFIALSPVGGRPEAVTRSFFGVNYVRINSNGDARNLQHGSTIHGAHRVRGLDGKPYLGRPQPTAYYHDAGGINLALMAARAHRGGRLENVAVVGLGAGAMACQSAAGESWTFYEIDRKVVELAQRPELFPFLSTCTPDARIVVGDGRLTLRRDSVRFDVIVLDAFSSDSVPAHLLTQEAFAGYAERLNPGGVVIAHVSNRHMDLRSVAEAAGLRQDMAVASARIETDAGDPKQRLQFAASTTVVAMSPDPGYVDALTADKRWRRSDPAVRALGWTDDYANVMGAMLRRLLGHVSDDE